MNNKKELPSERLAILDCGGQYTKVIDRKVRATEKAADVIRDAPAEKTDLDHLMEELNEDEVLRVKEIEFEPLTEEEALVKIDLLGHDFFAYTDRDSGMVNVLYRRDDGGYGLLKQKELVEA